MLVLVLTLSAMAAQLDRKLLATEVHLHRKMVADSQGLGEATVGNIKIGLLSNINITHA